MSTSLVIAPVPVADAVRMSRHIMELIPAYWEAQIAGRLSRFVGPTEEFEATMIDLLTQIWRATASAIREDEPDVVLRATMDPHELETALHAFERMLAFVPFAQEAGVKIEPDPVATAILQGVIDAFLSEIAASEEAAASED